MPRSCMMLGRQQHNGGWPDEEPFDGGLVEGQGITRGETPRYSARLVLTPMLLISAGTPHARAPSGISRTTHAPAPISAFSPILIPGMTVAPAPTKASRPIFTLPAILQPTATWAPSAIQQSWSIEAQVLITQKSSIRASALITAPAITAIPQPNLALSETTAAGLIAFTISNPICRTCRPTCTRRRLSPIPTNALRIPSRRSRGRSASVPRIDRPKIGEPAASRSIRPAI